MQELALTHWPFVAVALILGAIGEVLKRLVIPAENPKVLSGWRGVFRVTLPLHPVLAGALIGLIPGIPCPITLCTTAIASSLYYATAGMASGYSYAAIKHYIKERLSA